MLRLGRHHTVLLDLCDCLVVVVIIIAAAVVVLKSSRGTRVVAISTGDGSNQWSPPGHLSTHNSRCFVHHHLAVSL